MLSMLLCDVCTISHVMFQAYVVGFGSALLLERDLPIPALLLCRAVCMQACLGFAEFGYLTDFLHQPAVSWTSFFKTFNTTNRLHDDSTILPPVCFPLPSPCAVHLTWNFPPDNPIACFLPLGRGSGYYRRYLPKFVYVKSIIDSGTIGAVTSVNLRLSQSRHKFEGEEVRADWRVDATNAGGGLFMDLG